MESKKYMIISKKHRGVILGPSVQNFDSGAATFGCLYKEMNEDIFYLYYTGSIDTVWNKASIGVALSRDGLNFVKYKKNPLISLGKQSVTPTVFKAKGRYWMVFAYIPKQGRGRRLGIALADDPLGPWEFVKDLIHPTEFWEGASIDIGPSTVKINEETILIYYSNTNSFSNILFGPRYLRRQIGILVLIILGNKEIEVRRWSNNPLLHLNSLRGSWNESLFCPGYFNLGNKHYLLPTTSIYSEKYPYKQFIGLFEDISPYFEKPVNKMILIDGPKEKNEIMPVKSEIALDTPSPILRENELWLYYAVMDRTDRVWKTALTTFIIKDE
jgi:hypothetical protein